jgi:hypothetical protein
LEEIDIARDADARIFLAVVGNGELVAGGEAGISKTEAALCSKFVASGPWVCILGNRGHLNLEE